MTARELILQALGEASVCWDKDGIFQAERALKIAERLEKDLELLHISNGIEELPPRMIPSQGLTW